MPRHDSRRVLAVLGQGEHQRVIAEKPWDRNARIMGWIVVDGALATIALLLWATSPSWGWV